MAKLKDEAMDLVTAQVEAAAASKKQGITVFILVDGEGDCWLSETADASAYTAYKNGSEIALPSAAAEKAPAAKKKLPLKKKEVDEVEALLDSDTQTPSTDKPKKEKVMPTKTATKKAAKKPAAPKKEKAAKPRASKELVEIKATSIADAVKQAKKEGLKKAVVDIKGKKYGLRNAGGWAVVKSIVDISKDGMIMATDSGVYVYPKADFKTLFAKIFSSGTYKAIGIYAQSTVAASHDEYLSK
jgi:hypothetical protein